MVTLCWAALTGSKSADVCSFFAALRLFRAIYGLPQPLKRRKVRDSRVPQSPYLFDSAPRRLLELLKFLLTDSYILHDPSLVKEIQWSIDTISTGSLYAANVGLQTVESPHFKETDLMNLVQVFSARQMAPESPGLPRKRASSMQDSIPIVELNVKLPNGALECLMKVDDYDFDVFTLRAVTEHNELRTLMHIFFARTELIMNTGMAQELFSNFIERVQNGYIATNPYHTATHAADVVQAMHFYLGTCSGAAWLALTPLELAGCYLAASIHDYGHPGVNNTYLINTQSELAMRYNDRSVLENHHVSSALTLTLQEKYDFLAPLPKEDFQHIRNLMIEMVLSTDVALHFSLMTKFKSKMLLLSSTSKIEDKMLALSILMHAADISNASRPWDLCRRWTSLVMEEFWQQGDKEREQKHQIGYLNDKYTVNIAKSQLGFIDVIVEPLFKAIQVALPVIIVCCKNLEGNRVHWQHNVEREETELQARNREKPPEEPPANISVTLY